eukprot:TRINITY_DN12835_c0_g1_i3.p2 TRINITY_DN12835_c0_g1~~TRINITY_DN12835_c0_g1_i3.p2  ORF type:complete len:162 (-),score=10.38 TRINITY_DN12835_c0_g1_i3:460-945(-)
MQPAAGGSTGGPLERASDTARCGGDGVDRTTTPWLGSWLSMSVACCLDRTLTHPAMGFSRRTLLQPRPGTLSSSTSLPCGRSATCCDVSDCPSLTSAPFLATTYQTLGSPSHTSVGSGGGGGGAPVAALSCGGTTTAAGRGRAGLAGCGDARAGAVLSVSE